MRIERAINYLTWECNQQKKQKKLTKAKADAVNTVLDFVDIQQKQTLMENELFAKLFIEKFIMLCETNQNTALSALQEIERITNFSVYELVLKLKDKVPMMKFNSIGAKERPFDISKFNDYTYILERNKALVSDYSKELSEALKTPYSEKEAIQFVETQVNAFVNKNKKLQHER